MSSTDQFETVQVVEFVDDLASEDPAGTTRAHLPGFNVIRIAPHHVAEGSVVGDFHTTVDESNLVQSADIGGQAAVYAEHAVRN